MVDRDKIFLPLIMVIFSLIALKPLFLGFYHDDWATLINTSYHGGPFSWERLAWTLATFASRPVAGLVVYLLSSINGQSPFFWQGSVVFLSFSVIAAQFLFLRQLGWFFKERQETLKIILYSSIFFVYPWVMGGLNFVTAGIVILPAMLFFLVAGYFALQPPGKLSGKTIILAGMFYLLSGLTYELIYFQFLLFVLLRLLKTKRDLKKTSVLFLVFVTVQLAMITWNRFSATFGTDPVKALNPNWFWSTLDLVLGFTRTLAQAFADTPPLFTLLMIFSLTNLLLLIFFLYRQDQKSLLRFLSCNAVFGFCTLFAFLLYALAGYTFSGLGIASRTLVVPSFFFSLALFTADLFFQKTPKIMRSIYHLSFLAMGTVLVFVSVIRLNDWKKSWDTQKKILEALPKEKILQTDKDALIVYRGPNEVNGVTVFQAYWDIEGAVNAQMADVSQFRRYTVERDDWQTIWTGDQLIQSWQKDGQEIWELPAREVWVWDYPRHTFEQTLTPGRI